jgi:hypothetical protein
VPQTYEHAVDSLFERDGMSALPADICRRIWELVLAPTVVFSVLTPPRPVSVHYNERFDYRDCLKRLDDCYGFDVPYGTECNFSVSEVLNSREKVTFQMTVAKCSLLLINKQINSEAVKIGTDIFDIAASWIEDGKRILQAPPGDFVQLLSRSKMHFDCHIYELFGFLELASDLVLENITSVILGDQLYIEEQTKDRRAPLFDCFPCNVTAWLQFEGPAVVQFLKYRLPRFRELALTFRFFGD